MVQGVLEPADVDRFCREDCKDQVDDSGALRVTIAWSGTGTAVQVVNFTLGLARASC